MKSYSLQIQAIVFLIFAGICLHLFYTNVQPKEDYNIIRVIPERGRGFDKIADRIARFDEVDSVYLISGGYDFLVQIKGRSMKAVSSFVFDKLATLESVQSTATHFVLKKYKDHGVTMESHEKEARETVIL